MTDNPAQAKPLKFYDRLKLATQHRLAEPILALLCFLEAMILPIFPEIMLAPMIVADRRRAWRLAAICTASSVIGGWPAMPSAITCSIRWVGRSSISTAPETALPR